MPEFAEVNKQVRWLRERVTGMTVERFGYTGGHFPELKEDPGKVAKLKAFFEGAVIREATQRGKHVVLSLSTGTLTSHLMFAGRWTLRDDPFTSNYKRHKEAPIAKASSFWCEGAGKRLEFNEPEYRGKVHAHPGIGTSECDDLRELGPDVLITPETDPAYRRQWELEDFAVSCGRGRTAVKALLLDQKHVAGIGNMYACESLYSAGVAPERGANTLGDAEVRAVYDAAREVIQRAMDTDLDYAQVLQVYKLAMDPRGRAVKTVKIAGRDSYWVPEAQR